MEESEFNIRVKTDVDLAGLKATLAALEADTAAAQRMGVAVGDSHKEIDAIKSKITAYESSARKASEAVEGLELSHHELKAAVHELLGAGGLPELATLLHGIFNPEALGVFTGVLAVQQLSKYLGELKQRAVDTAQAMRELREGLIAAHVTATQEATYAQAEFQRSIDAVGQSQDHLTHQTERAIDALKLQATQTETLIDLQLELYKARMKAAVVEGKMTPGQADAQTQALERQARAQKDAAQDEETKGAIKAKRDRDLSAQGQISADETALSGLTARAAQQSEGLLDAQDRKKTFDKQLESAQKAADAADAAFNTADHGRSYQQVGLGPHGEALFGSVQNDAKQAAEKAVADKTLEAAQGNVAEINKKIAQTQEDYNATEDLIKTKRAHVLAMTELSEQYKLAAEDIAADLQRTQQNRKQREALADTVQAAQNRTTVEERLRVGTATAAEVAQFHAAGEHGAEAALDASQAVAQARGFMANLRGRVPSQGEKAQIDIFAGEVLGFLEIHDAQLRSQHDSLSDVLARLRTLQTATRPTGFQY